MDTRDPWKLDFPLYFAMNLKLLLNDELINIFKQKEDDSSEKL